MSKYTHECPEWDFLEIDETDAEFLACACFSDDQEYQDTLRQCALGDHPERAVSEAWSYYGNPDVPHGTVDFKVKNCHFCGDEW